MLLEHLQQIIGGREAPAAEAAEASVAAVMVSVHISPPFVPFDEA
jgi:hypothetical protein